ncbi:MAG: hypothetical protein JJU11_07155 [Candidatus Sumerlaeia bacterium]|nr:hypothetical protein [Candidatus Sumerlaeia bacterium]
MMSRPNILLLLLPMLAFVAGCAKTGVVTFSPESIYPQFSDTGERPRPAPSDPRIVVVPFTDERSDLRSQYTFAHVPILEFGTLFFPFMTSHPEQAIAPAPDKPLETVGGMALMNALREVDPSLVIDFLPTGGNDTIPASYDIVISGRIKSTNTKHVAPSYGLNFFTLVDLSVVPKLLGAPTERMAGELIVVVEARERWSGRLIQRGELHWISPTYSTGYYSSGGFKNRPAVRYYSDWAAKAFPALGERLLVALKENPS